MLCFECGEEMRLVQVTKDTTVAVSGYEQHTWECPACSAVEQRIAFDRDTIPTQTAPPLEPTTVSAEPTQRVLTQHIAAMRAEPTEAAPVELPEPVPPALTQSKLVERVQTPSVEPGKTAAIQPTHPPLPAAVVKTNAWAKAMDEKLRSFKERSAAAREVSRKTARPTQFNRDGNDKPPSGSSTSSILPAIEPCEARGNSVVPCPT
jgi:hypothetical protein